MFIGFPLPIHPCKEAIKIDIREVLFIPTISHINKGHMYIFLISASRMVQRPGVLHVRVDNKDPCTQTMSSCHKILLYTFCNNNLQYQDCPSVATTRKSLEGAHLRIHIY